MAADEGKPTWLKIRPSSSLDFSRMKTALRKRGLVTVCEEAHCPNMAECWHGEGTATFMVMGDTCTRGCRFCAIATAKTGRPLNPEEPFQIAKAVAEMDLDYAVITSVDRDDLPDQGAAHFAACIRAIRKENPKTHIEVLIPDFQGKKELVQRIVDAKPDVIAHNIETVERLQSAVRDPRANYLQSLSVLRMVKDIDRTIHTKSSIMLGLGESEVEVHTAMADLRSNDCDILTLGQYLKPGNRHLKVHEYVHPDIFAAYKQTGEELGFLYVASGPFVRSSYRAGELFMQNLLKKKENRQATGVIASQET